jgi:hypothetical protein
MSSISNLNDQAAETISRGLQLLADADLTVKGRTVIQVAEAIRNLGALYNRLMDNTLQLIDPAEEAGPPPEESEDADG